MDYTQTSSASGSHAAIRADSEPSGSSTRSRRGPARGGNGLPPGQKLKIRVDDAILPISPKSAVAKLSSAASSLASRDLRVCYSDVSQIDQGDMRKIIAALDEQFEYEGLHTVEGDHVYKVIKDAWKRRKSMLYRTYIKDKNPILVKSQPAPQGIPIEDWHWLIDHCNTLKYQEASSRNKVNRASQREPNCGGKTPTQIYRHELAVQQNVSEYEVDRGDVYLRMHTRKDQTPQRSDWVDSIRSSQSSNPTPTSVDDDAVSKTCGPEGRGRLRGMGAGFNKTLLKKLDPLFKKQRAEKKSEEDHRQKTDKNIETLTLQMAQMREIMQAQLDMMAQSVRPTPPVHAGSTSTGPVQVGTVGLDTRVVAFGGWPYQDVALGIVTSVDPNDQIGDRILGEGNYLIYVDTVLVTHFVLPEPHNDWYTLSDVGQGHVIWPKNHLKISPS